MNNIIPSHEWTHEQKGLVQYHRDMVRKCVAVLRSLRATSLRDTTLKQRISMHTHGYMLTHHWFWRYSSVDREFIEYSKTIA